MDVDYLEVILKKKDADERIVKITNVEMESAVPKGQNYSSIITRVTLDVILGSGRRCRKFLIVKEELQTGKTKEFVADVSAFKTEIKIYSNLLKKMEHLMAENGDTRDMFWGNLVAYEEYNRIIFEDLSKIGFVVADRRNSLDLHQGLLVMTEIGRFHAMSKVLFQNGVISKSDFVPYWFIQDLPFFINLFKGGLQQLSLTMRKHWAPEWKNMADKIEKEVDVVMDKIKAMYNKNIEAFPVVCHADLWTCNMMFKYGIDKKPIALRLLDFQGTHVNCYVYDVVYFLYSSIDPAVRRGNSELFYKTYWESLTHTLELHGYEGAVPTLDDVTSVAESYDYFGFIVSSIFYPILIAEGENAFDIEATCDPERCKEAFSVEALKSERFISKVTEDLVYFSNKGVI